MGAMHTMDTTDMTNATDVTDAPVRVGIIGYGNMGRAIALGVLERPALNKRFPLLVYTPSPGSAEAASEQGLPLAPDAAALAARADIIIPAVKPYRVATVLAEAAPALGGDKLVLSIAAGLTLDALRGLTSGRCPVARVMPNTLALVGEGLFGLCLGSHVPEGLQKAVRALFGGLGTLVELDEARMNAFTALAGSGPAYLFYFMDALAEAGVSAGLDREDARAIARALTRGAAAMAARPGAHPAVLREQVASPAGTTIAALNHLDRTGVRGHVIDAVLAALARAKAMEEGA